MPRKAAPKLTPAQARAEIRRLKARCEEESGRRIAAESEHEALLHQIRQARPIGNLESVNFDRTATPRSTVEAELTRLYELIGILDTVDATCRHRLLSMIDARYYDPPAKAAR